MVAFLFLVLKRIKKSNRLKINIVITVGHHVPLWWESLEETRAMAL